MAVLVAPPAGGGAGGGGGGAGGGVRADNDVAAVYGGAPAAANTPADGDADADAAVASQKARVGRPGGGAGGGLRVEDGGHWRGGGEVGRDSAEKRKMRNDSRAKFGYLFPSYPSSSLMRLKHIVINSSSKT